MHEIPTKPKCTAKKGSIPNASDVQQQQHQLVVVPVLAVCLVDAAGTRELTEEQGRDGVPAPAPEALEIDRRAPMRQATRRQKGDVQDLLPGSNLSLICEARQIEAAADERADPCHALEGVRHGMIHGPLRQRGLRCS